MMQDGPWRWLSDLGIAIRFLTRLRLPARWQPDDRPLATAVLGFPLVGVAVGLVGGLVYCVAVWLDLPPLPAAVLAVASQVLFTGALHEDGLGDFCDGLGGASSVSRLAIMHDSRAGNYAVVALLLVVMLRVGAVAALADCGLVLAALIAAGALSRAAMVWLMNRLPAARADGLGQAAGRADDQATWAATALALAIGLLAVGFLAGSAGFIAAAVITAGLGRLAYNKLGGQTGDVLGAGQQLAEAAVLAAVLAVA